MVTPLGPCDHRRQGHEDGFRIAARLQAELGTTVIKEIELDIPATAHQLVGAFGLGPGLIQMASDDFGIDVQKRFADRTGKGKMGLRIVIEIIIKDAANTSMLIPVWQEEILISPILEARIMLRIKPIASLFEACVKSFRIRIIRHDRVEIGAAAEPDFRGLDMTCIHMNRRHMGRSWMGDQGYAACPKRWGPCRPLEFAWRILV